MTGWHREDWFDATGLPWVNPSPNIRNLNEALLYPGLAMLEYSTNYSVGRGTDAPFEQIGADWIRGADLARRLSALDIPGVRISADRIYAGFVELQRENGSRGCSFVVTNRDVFSSSQLGLAVAAALQTLYPKKIALDVNRNLIGNGGVIRALATGGDPALAANANLKEFLELRLKFLLYN